MQSKERCLVYTELLGAFGLDTPVRERERGGPADIQISTEVPLAQHQRVHHKAGACRACKGLTMASPVQMRALFKVSTSSWTWTAPPRASEGCKEGDVPLYAHSNCRYLWHYGK